MRIVWLQHVPFEGPGAIADWAASRGHEITGVHLYRGDALPGDDAFDMLVAMGGPMSVNDTDVHKWLVGETALIGRTIRAGKPVFGVCLGAQLIARSLGAAVYPAPQKEIGWFPVTRVRNGDNARAHTYDNLPATFIPLHWHGETFNMPPGGVRLAESPVCANQAIQVGPRTVGLQFHIEATPTSVAALCDNCGDEIAGGEYQQSADEIRDCEHHVEPIHPILFALLDYLIRPLG